MLMNRLSDHVPQAVWII
ncbi:hypothetical protein [Yokenella regensburgei]